MTFRNLYRKSAIALAVTGALAGGQVIADDTDSLMVTAVVEATCTIQSVDVLDFGTLDLVTDVQQTADITWVCTNNFDTTISLDGGESNDIANRRMTGTANGDTIPYQLYTDNTYSAGGSVFGDGNIGNPVDVTGAGFGNPQTTTVYGELIATDAQNVQADDYDDDVTVTIAF